jgi:hypothetical protein
MIHESHESRVLDSMSRVMSRVLDSESSDESSARLSESSQSTQSDFLTGPAKMCYSRY